MARHVIQYNFPPPLKYLLHMRRAKVWKQLGNQPGSIDLEGFILFLQPIDKNRQSIACSKCHNKLSPSPSWPFEITLLKVDKFNIARSSLGTAWHRGESSSNSGWHLVSMPLHTFYNSQSRHPSSTKTARTIKITFKVIAEEPWKCRGSSK